MIKQGNDKIASKINEKWTTILIIKQHQKLNWEMHSEIG